MNAELVLMHWRIAAGIRHDILGQERAANGDQIVSPLSRQLTEGYGAGLISADIDECGILDANSPIFRLYTA